MSPAVGRRMWWGVGAVSAALVVALSALVVAPDGHLAFGVESASSAASALVQRPAATFPRIYALFAGMVAALNPCGFALLPAYLGLYLRSADGRAPSGVALIWQPVKVSLAVAAAFIAAFGLVGLALGAAGAVVSALFPWLGLLVGVVLIMAGGGILAGWTAYGWGQGLAQRVGGVAARGGLLGYVAYGLAYALASLGCALPIFLTVLGSALVAGSWLGEVLQFVLYGVGMAVTLAAVTVVAAMLKTQLIARLKSVGRVFDPISAVLLLLVGTYLIYYWLTVGGLLRGGG